MTGCLVVPDSRSDGRSGRSKSVRIEGRGVKISVLEAGRVRDKYGLISVAIFKSRSDDVGIRPPRLSGG